MNDAYGFPANIGKSIFHADAYKFSWKPDLGYDWNFVCSCCKEQIGIDFSVKEEKTSIFCGEKKEFKLQSGVALFFTFIKYLVVMCLIRSLTIDIFNMVSSLLEGDYCFENCSRQFYTYVSVIYKYNREDLLITTNLFSLVTVGVMIFYFLIYRRLMYRMHDIIDSDSQTQDAFTVFVTDIPILNLVPGNEEVKFDIRRAVC